MSEMSFEQAAQALSEASSAPEPGRVPAAEAPPAASPAPAEVAPTSNQETPAAPAADETPDSFTGIDPNSLPPELKSLYAGMQADYVRKTQSIAEQRKQFDGLDVERASQAVQFLDALETDPNFVVQVHQQLTQALTEAGLSPAAAAEQAAQTIQEQGAQQTPQYDEYGNEIGQNPLEAQVAELQAFKAQFEQQQAEMAMAQQLQSAEMSIRQQNPTWTDDDMSAVFEIAFAHGGNLTAASEAYKGLQERLISSYIESKSEAAGAAPVVLDGGASSAAVPEKAGWGEDLNAAHKAALAHLANSMAGS